MDLLQKIRWYLLDDDSSDLVGQYGEDLTADVLKWSKRFGYTGMTLRNVYIPKGDGETSEIDLVYITKKGIFVIESKNYSGWIFGNGADQYWTQMFPNKQKKRFYNPIKQNRTHIRWLLELLGEEIRTFSMIVFSERCELKKIDFDGKDIWLCKRDELFGSIRYVWKHEPDILSEEKIIEIVEKLTPLTNAATAVKQAHIADIERKMMRPEKCPRCGAALVLRTAKKGANAGNQFYGCSAFPKCRYIMQIPETEDANGNQHEK